jgi:hypothetical protein
MNKKSFEMNLTLRVSGLGLRPSGFDPTRKVQRSGLKKPRKLLSKGSCPNMVINPATVLVAVKIV